MYGIETSRSLILNLIRYSSAFKPQRSSGIVFAKASPEDQGQNAQSGKIYRRLGYEARTHLNTGIDLARGDRNARFGRWKNTP
jgi:hypothetical protein